MSISADDSGTPCPNNGTIPLDELRALSWMEIRARHEARYPGLARYLDDAEFADAQEIFIADAVSFDVPVEYIHALRVGVPDASYKLTVGGTPIRIAVATDRNACTPDPRRENESWQQLRHLVATTACAGIVPDLPHELALAVWERDGREVWACRPGTSTGALRRARRRRRFTALCPLPFLGTLGQSVTSGTCAASFALAPVLPAPPPPDSVPGIVSRPPAVTAYAPPQPTPEPVSNVVAPEPHVSSTPSSSDSIIATAIRSPSASTPTPTTASTSSQMTAQPSSEPSASPESPAPASTADPASPKASSAVPAEVSSPEPGSRGDHPGSSHERPERNRHSDRPHRDTDRPAPHREGPGKRHGRR